MPNFAQNLVFNGLGTLQTVLVPDSYFIKGKISLPTITTSGAVSGSQVATTIVQNSTVVYTGVSGAEGFYKTILCTGTDTISIIFSSPLASDAALNVIKSTISIGSGE